MNNSSYQPATYQLTNDRAQRAKEESYVREKQGFNNVGDHDAFGFGEKELSWSNAINKLLARPKKSFQWSTF